MNNENLASNPFAALFPSLSQAQEFSASIKPGFSQSAGTELEEAHGSGVSSEDHTLSDDAIAVAEENLKITNIIEDVFLITLDKEPGKSRHPSRCVYLEEVKTSLKGQDWLDVDCLGQAVFERLMLENPGQHVLAVGGSGTDTHAASEAGESQTLRYLHGCYSRVKRHSNKEGNVLNCVEKCRNIIIDNGKMCFQHPEFFPNLDPAGQFNDIFMDEYNSRDGETMLEFFDCIVKAIGEEQVDGSLLDAFRPVLENIRSNFRSFSLGDSTVFIYLDLLSFFTRDKGLAQVFMQFNQPSDPTSGHSYEDTLIGTVLAISCIAKNESGPFEFFDHPSRYSKQEHDITENSIHQPLGILNERLYQLIYGILKLGDEPRNMILQWLGNCLHANAGRAKIWSRHGILPGLFNQMYCSDGFFLNLCAVLLRLCQPFSTPNSARLLKIQPTYCLATLGQQDQLRARNVHMRDLAEETCLVPSPAENEQLKVEANYNFVTECFFLTQKSINLGLHVVQEKFFRLNQDLHRVQTLYQDILRQGGENTDPGQRIKEQMEKGMSVFLCLKSSLTEPKLLDLCFNFHVATATYLTHMATSGDFKQFSPVTFPLSSDAPPGLACLPEFVAENIMDFAMFLRRFRDSLFEVQGDRLEHLMTLVLVFMGSPERMRNPHLRARLAETLEALMPPKDDQPGSMAMSHYQRQQLFHKHPLAVNLGQTLLHVFVSIEMTGQGVEFEQKFNYRRPMYQILDHIWKIDIHSTAIKSLAQYSEEHIEDTDPPLFLRFINLLINDAIFLLDEALQYMTQIKEKQEEKERGAWESLAANQRQENESNLRQLSMLARFHNLMGNDTIHTLEFISREVTSIFTHNVMVDRIAAMLNFFLLHLVGPKKKHLKVKDFDEVDFKPQELVSNISQIYLNLGGDERFCMAVSGDGRSYSHDLFVQAEKVLVKINQPAEMIMQFTEFGAKVKAMAEQQQEEEEAMLDAPDEFLDPIMGTLMKDPVLLPSSHQIVDRATIARHVLSDQSDPFNRDPLSMDMVKPVDELRDRIHQWINSQKAKAQAKNVTDS